jgi:MFS transporter, SP family, solute carrier family 2 (myo-inositol transporter), member 13
MTQDSSRTFNLFLLAVAGLGGLLYGIDIGVIDPALAYLNRSIRLTEAQLSTVVAAVLAGSILGSVVAGVLADWLGRKRMMIVSGLLFVASVAIIYVSQDFEALMVGRLLQGLSGGVIAVVVPLYLAECLPSGVRGRGAAVFQFLLTVGIVLAAFVGSYYIRNAEQAIALAGADEAQVVAAADHAWRSMFLTVVYPGVVFLLGTLFVPESPRWLVRHGRPEAARHVLARMRPQHGLDAELAEIGAALAEERARPRMSWLAGLREIFTERKYVLPFVLACIILGCNQTTGINSILQFMSTILQKAGLDPVTASSYGTAIKIVNSAMTIVAIVLVERRGRVFLLKVGTGGIVVSLCVLAGIFYHLESRRVDVRAEVAALVQGNRLDLDVAQAAFARGASEPLQLAVLYHHGDQQQVAEAFMPTAASQQVLVQEQAVKRGLDPAVRAALERAETLQQRSGKLDGGDQLAVDAARKQLAALPSASRAVIQDAQRIRTAQHLRIAADGAQPLVIDRASVGPIPGRTNGLLTALCIGTFIAFFSIGPGVCVWLALSELMPTRIRSVGMGVALLINQGTGTVIAAAFLPIVGNFGFYAMFLFWAACTVVYFITAAFFLPETKGKTLEQIEAWFAQGRAAPAAAVAAPATSGEPHA